MKSFRFIGPIATQHRQMLVEVDHGAFAAAAMD